jgi:hypothetical protein
VYLKTFIWLIFIAITKFSNSHYENNFGVSSAKAAGNTKIVFFESPLTVGFQKKQFL